MLKRVVENNDVAATAPGVLAPRNAIFRDDNCDIGIERLVHEHFIVAVSAQHDRRLRPRSYQSAGEVRREGSLPRPTNR